VAVRANPESLREIGVVGIGGKLVETGDTEDWGLVPALDLLVVGLSDLLLSVGATAKALKIGGRATLGGSGSPNAVELWVTHFPRALAGALGVNSEAFSDENASYGNDSMAYGGGPVATPYRSL
jgi:hypothetical protein